MARAQFTKHGGEMSHGKEASDFVPFHLQKSCEGQVEQPLTTAVPMSLTCVPAQKRPRMLTLERRNAQESWSQCT